MIETAALFFSLACMPYAIDLIRRIPGWRSPLLFLVFATAAVLQKSTTGGPVLLFLFLTAIFIHIKNEGLTSKSLARLSYVMFIFCVPIIIGLAWAHYTDIVKMHNAFGSQLTSQALGTWNFGTLKQKLSLATWRLIVWNRSITWNAGGFIGVVILLLPWLWRTKQCKYAYLSLAAIILFLLPPLIFTNLHYVHEYYQTACVVFLLASLAIVIGGCLSKATGIYALVPIVTAVLVVSNVMVFYSAYGIVAARTLDQLDPRSVQSYKVGRYLREHTPQGTGLVIFGQSYSSEIGFQSQRKSITVPIWFKEYKKLWENPRAYLGGLPLSAIVICPVTDQFPTLDDIHERLISEPEWIHKTVQGCELLLTPSSIKGAH